MTVESSISDTTEAIIEALGKHDLSAEEQEEISKHVSALLLKTLTKTAKNNAETVANCCGPELDLAHQIRAEINRQTEVLINNLKALR